MATESENLELEIEKPAEKNVSWKEPCLAWFITRVFCIGLMYAGAYFFPCNINFKSINPGAGSHGDLSGYFEDYAANPAAFGKYPMVGVQPGGQWSWLKPMVRWDSIWYLSIVHAGYVSDPDLPTQQNTAFFPLYPALIRGLSFVGINPLIGGLLISNLATLLCTCLLFRFVSNQYGPSAARWSILMWLCYPGSVFGSSIYAEPLLALFMLLAIYQVQNQKYLATGLLAAVASVARPPGLLIGLSILNGWRDKRKHVLLLGLMLSGVGLVVHFAWLGYRFGDPLLYFHGKSAWGTGMETSTPWNPLRWGLTVVAATFQAVALFIRGEPDYHFYSCRFTDTFLMYWTFFSLLAVRKMGLGVFLMTLSMYMLPLVARGSVSSMGRFSWVLIPIFVMSGVKLSGSKYRYVTLLLFICMHAWLAFLFGGGWEVI